MWHLFEGSIDFTCTHSYTHVRSLHTNVMSSKRWMLTESGPLSYWAFNSATSIPWAVFSASARVCSGTDNSFLWIASLHKPQIRQSLRASSIWAAPKAQWVLKACSHEAHCNPVSMRIRIELNLHPMRINRIHMAQQVSRFKANCVECGCYT